MESLVTNPVNFQRFACFYESNESLRNSKFEARNESLKIEICESESLWILKIRIRESGFVTPNLKDSYRGFVSWIRFWKIRFVDLLRANKNLKLLDSFRFVRIRIRIPHPYFFSFKNDWANSWTFRCGFNQKKSRKTSDIKSIQPKSLKNASSSSRQTDRNFIMEWKQPEKRRENNLIMKRTNLV